LYLLLLQVNRKHPIIKQIKNEDVSDEIAGMKAWEEYKVRQTLCITLLLLNSCLISVFVPSFRC